jgi:protoheme IX farnesyltransferase
MTSAVMPSTWQTVRAYIALTKPNIIWLLLITTVPAMVLGHRFEVARNEAVGAWPSLWLVAATLWGGMLAAGSASAINQYADRDLDSVMTRTRRRPLVRGLVPPQRAVVFGIALGMVASAWLVLTVNVLAAALAVSAIAFYVGIYTYWLKRSTWQNIVIGGAAGAAPTLIGWAAVTGRLDSVVPLFLFLIVFWWTPPHFWALALVLEDDYRAAGVPMLPVVQGENATKVHILLWAVMLVALTVLFAGVAHLGGIYLGTAVVGGGGFVALAARLLRTPGIRGAWGLFKYSTYYLAALFVAIVVDAVAGA